MSRRKPVELTPAKIAALRACPMVRVHDAVEIYGLGRNRLYDFMKDGSLPFKKLGGITLLSVEGLEALVRPDPRP